MNEHYSRYHDREYSAEELARFDTTEKSCFMRDGREIGGQAAMVTGVMREHTIMPGLTATLMDGEILGEFLTQTSVPSGLTIFMGFKANGYTRYGTLSLPHQTLPNILYVYSSDAVKIEQQAYIGPYQTIAIHFADEKFCELLETHCLDETERDNILVGLNTSGPCHYWSADPQVLEGLHSLIYTELTGIDLSLFVNQTVMGLLRALIQHITAGNKESTRAAHIQLQARDIRQIEKAGRYIEQNLDAKLTLEAVALKAGVSVPYLKSNFPRVYGDSVSSYVHKLRMNQARVMLASGGKTIQRVAAQVGYASQASFTTAFRKYHSMTPNEAAKSFFQNL